jgi:hypothetical protein
MPDITEQIHNELHEWQRKRAARIPEQAQQIIVAAVSAIIYDPYPGWCLPSGMEPWPSMEAGFREIQQDAIKKLPMLLDEVAEKSPGGTNINTFTLLHLISSILDKICPFAKQQ